MEHDDRVRRLNILLGALPVQAEIGDTENQLDRWECALVRAAAEITGLTPEVAQEVINGLAPAFDEESIILRRYTELAK